MVSHIKNLRAFHHRLIASRERLKLTRSLPFQIWAGNEACEPVTWRECKLVPRQVDFKVPKVECTDGEEIPYTELVDVEKIQMTTSMTCEVSRAECSIIKLTNAEPTDTQVLPAN